MAPREPARRRKSTPPARRRRGHAPSTHLREFREFRERQNRRILDTGTQVTKRFFRIDAEAYEDGALAGRVKELCGLVASMVLRCDDCITYHLVRCAEAGYSHREIVEAFDVALVVGGSIVIPHLRRAHRTLEELRVPAPDGS